MRTKLAALTFLVLGWASPASAADLRATVDAAVLPVMAEHHIAGMAVAVTHNGKRHFFNYGEASRETQSPVSENTIFELGSVSKTFNATLGGYAEAKGKLSLVAHPAEYLPQLKGSAVDAATLLHLGTYTAGGLPLQFPDGIAGDAQIWGYFQQWKADAAPGVQRRYSNPSIGLFGRIAAVSLGSDYASLMQTVLFPALGLERTYIHVPASEMDGYASGYDKQDKPVRVNPGALDAEAYGVKSTAADMLRFVESNIAPDTADAAVNRAIRATHIGYFGVGKMVQGLGWEQYPYPLSLDALLAGNSPGIILQPQPVKPILRPAPPSKPTLFNKTGSTGGFGAYVAFVPEARIGIVILANKNYPIPARIKIAHTVLEQLSASGR